jgi:hypothetical protein
MRSLRLLDDTCPHCGQFRHSKAAQSTAAKIRIILYAGVGCFALKYFLDVPLIVSVPLLLVPFGIVIWRYYQPFKATE